MNFQNNIAWYYVGVMALLLLGQNVVMGNAQKDIVAKLNAKHEQQLAAAGRAPAATPAVATANAAPASTLVAAPVAVVPAAPPPAAAPAMAAKPEPKALVASAAPEKPAVKGPGKDLPVALAFRSEPFNKGKLVTLTNTSNDKLACKVKVKRPSTGESKAFTVTVAASGEARLKAGQGWTFKSGDQIQLAQAGFKSKTASVP